MTNFALCLPHVPTAQPLSPTITFCCAIKSSQTVTPPLRFSSSPKDTKTSATNSLREKRSKSRTTNLSKQSFTYSLVIPSNWHSGFKGRLRIWDNTPQFDSPWWLDIKVTRMYGLLIPVSQLSECPFFPRIWSWKTRNLKSQNHLRSYCGFYDNAKRTVIAAAIATAIRITTATRITTTQRKQQ